ncbi:MAG: DMT family transporter [Caldibacillus sp.]
MRKSRQWRGLVLVILGASFWGIGGTVSQRLFQEQGILVDWLVTVRLLGAGALLLLLSWLFGDRTQIFKIWRDKKSLIQLLIFAIFGMLAVQYTYMASIEAGNAAVATLLQYLGPVFILFYSLFTRKSKLNFHTVFAVCLALTGTFLMLTNGSWENLAVPGKAIFWGIASGVAMAFYTVYPVSLLDRFGSLVVIGWSMIIGGLVMSLKHPPWMFDAGNWSIETYSYLLFVIVFGTLLGFWFYLDSLHYLTPQATSLLANMEPLTSILSSIFWLGMSFGTWQILGMALIIFLVIYLTLMKNQYSRPEKQVSGKESIVTNNNIM